MEQPDDTSQPDPIQQLARTILAIPKLVARCERALLNTHTPGTVAGWLWGTPAHHALEHACQTLAVASDGLTGLAHLMTGNDSTATHLTVRTHLAADVTLARQTLESAMVANWILEPDDLHTLWLRGFAAAWRSADEQRKFADKAATASTIYGADRAREMIGRSATLVSELTDEGRNPPPGLTPALKSGNDGKPTPVTPVPTMTDLAQRTTLCDGRAPGWHAVYALTSGLAHGYTWAFLAGTRRTERATHVHLEENGSITDSGVRVMDNRPNNDIIAIVTTLAFRECRKAIRRLEHLSQTPAPV